LPLTGVVLNLMSKQDYWPLWIELKSHEEIMTDGIHPNNMEQLITY
jgi:hypothetical protein